MKKKTMLAVLAVLFTVIIAAGLYDHYFAFKPDMHFVISENTETKAKPLTFSQKNNTNQIPFMSKTLAMYDYRKLPEIRNEVRKEIRRII